jgi:hypothetical protein
VPVTSEQFQPTPLTPGAAPTAAPTGPKARRPRADPNKVGIVLIHGIGEQKPAETFLDWTRPVVALLADWRREHGFDVDPVRRSQYAFNGASLPFLELEIPAVGEHVKQMWIVTEAWWATQLRPPSLGTVTAFLRHGLARIAQGIRAGYDDREDAWVALVNQELAAVRAPGGTGGPLEGSPDVQRREAAIIERTLAAADRWAWIRTLDSTQKWLTGLALAPTVLLGTLLLLLYAPFRAIPFKPLRDFAVFRQADNYLVRWIGELPVLLGDPVQAANVRARAAEAIEGLEQQGCGRIVIVAHSGGAIVSFTMLLDPIYLERKVAKLITIGQGLGLAWHLVDRSELLDRGNRLAGDLAGTRPELEWYDYWASYDPAPGGPLTHPRALPLPVTSRPITNRMSIFEDHGSYWQNDEGFLIALIRHLDTAAGRVQEALGSRFFPDRGHRAVLIERRRQRVGVLALWRWMAVLAAIVPIVAGTVLAPAGGGLVGIGRATATFWGTVPAHELVSAPIDWLAGILHGPVWLADVGAWLLGATFLAALFLVAGLIGIRWWSSWDARERLVAHSSILQPVDRRAALGTFVVLVVVTALISAAVTWAVLR